MLIFYTQIIMKIWNQKTLPLSLTLMLLIRLEKNLKPIQQSPLRIVHLSTRKGRKFWLNLWWQRTWIWNGKVWKAGGTDIAYCFFWHLAYAWRWWFLSLWKWTALANTKPQTISNPSVVSCYKNFMLFLISPYKQVMRWTIAISAIYNSKKNFFAYFDHKSIL